MKKLVILGFGLLTLLATVNARAAEEGSALPWLDQPACVGSTGLQLSHGPLSPEVTEPANLNPLDSATPTLHGGSNPCACSHNFIECLTFCNGNPTCDAACDAAFRECLCDCKGIC